MPKLTDEQVFDTLEDPAYLIGTQGGEVGRFLVSDILTAPPVETASTIGTLISGADEKTVPVDADTFGLSDSAASNILKRLSWVNIKATLKTYFDTLYSSATTPIDLTGASSDYALAVGETAYIDYLNTTSVPLYIDCTSGQEYEIDIFGDNSGTAIDDTVTLTPNYGGTVPASNSIYRSDVYQLDGSTPTPESLTNLSSFYASSGYVVHTKLVISTSIKSKCVSFTSYSRRTSNRMIVRGSSYWTNTTTAWVSLGLMSSLHNQSGKVVIRRIL